MTDWSWESTSDAFVKLPSGAWVRTSAVVAVKPWLYGEVRVVLADGTSINAGEGQADDIAYGIACPEKRRSDEEPA